MLRPSLFSSWKAPGSLLAAGHVGSHSAGCVRAVEVGEAKECEVCVKVVEDVTKAVFKKLPSASRAPCSAAKFGRLS